MTEVGERPPTQSCNTSPIQGIGSASPSCAGASVCPGNPGGENMVVLPTIKMSGSGIPRGYCMDSGCSPKVTWIYHHFPTFSHENCQLNPLEMGFPISRRIHWLQRQRSIPESRTRYLIIFGKHMKIFPIPLVCHYGGEILHSFRHPQIVDMNLLAPT